MTTYLFTCAAVPRLRKLNEGFHTPTLLLPILGTLIALAVGAVIYVLSPPTVVTTA